MKRFSALVSAPVILFTLVACGGGGSSSSSTGFTGAAAASFSTAVINEEGVQATSSTLPTWASDPSGSNPDVKMAMNLAPVSACVSASPITVDGQGVSHVTWTYTNCTGPEGGTLNGTRAISWIQDPNNANAIDYTIVPNITIANGTYTWTISGGTRSLVVDSVLKNTTITVRDMTATLTNSGDPNFSASYTWSRDMVADWSVAGEYQLSGSFSFQNSASDRGPVTGTISSADPLIWQTGCCHPMSGTVNLVRVLSGKTATVSFSQPCGTRTITLPDGTVATKTLACPS